MVMDRNNRSHKPKGTPDGGRFETGDTGGASGDVAAPGMDPATCLTVREFDDANRRMDGWYGRLAGLEKSGDDHDIRRIRGWSAAFDRWQRIHGDEVGAFESYSRTHADEIAAYEEKRGKELSSAREAAAYMLAKAGLLNESVRRGNMLALADEHDWGALGDRIAEGDGAQQYSHALAGRYGLDPERERILMEDTDAHLGEESDPGQAAREMDRRYRLAARLLGNID